MSTNTNIEKVNFKVFEISDRASLEMMEKKERNTGSGSIEMIPYAQNGTSYTEIAESIVVDMEGEWKNPLMMTVSFHKAQTGARVLCKMASDFFLEEAKKKTLDILSLSACMEGTQLKLVMLFRCYQQEKPDMMSFFETVGDEIIKEDEDVIIKGQLIIPDEIKNFHYTENEIKEHDDAYKVQNEILLNATEEEPFLNSIEKYVPKQMFNPEDTVPLIYDLKTADMQLKLITPYHEFQNIFERVMIYVNGIEYYRYVAAIEEPEKEEEFMTFLEEHVRTTYVNKQLFIEEDVPALMNKLYCSLFKLYVVQDLIDDEDVTDIKITAPDSIRARVKGKAYMSNITFIDENDYKRFINAIAIRNGIVQNKPVQTFTDTKDDNYILRFSLTAEYVNSVNYPYMHIRKVARKKPLADELIKAGMFDEKIRDYLIDCGRHSRGVVFAGPPGSGKTVCLNWFLEDAYEQSAEILVIQENDELFAYRQGVMFQHVVNYASKGREPVNLEGLGQLALVAGANVFVIGEAKGAEICSAITLSNSGCRTALTIHTPSSTETIDKMADLALRGYANNYDEAKRMIKSFQTIVYLEDFCVKEISEIIGYDEEKKDMIYRAIYRKK